jgi:hypothetical protein
MHKLSPSTIAQLKKAFRSYVRSAIATVAMTLFSPDPASLTGWALLVAFVGPLARAIDPTDDAFGIGAAVTKAAKEFTGKVTK